MKALILIAALLVPGAAVARDAAPSAIGLDYASGEAFHCERCDAPMPPSSLTKLMALELVFQRLKDGRLKRTDTVRVFASARARTSADGEATMGLRPGTFVSVDQLIKGIVVQSAGDAALALAEAIGGSERQFAEMMNRRAAELGLTHSHFVNARGVTDPGQYMSARDIARLAAHLVRSYPAYYRYFASASFVWNGRAFYNRNGLLGMAGVDGLKTGHTLAGGYSLAASAVRDGRRVIVVVNGLPSEHTREREAWRLIELGFDRAGAHAPAASASN